MESKIPNYAVLKFLMLLFAIIQLNFLISQYFLIGLNLDGNVMLDIEDVRSKGFSVDIPFRFSHSVFYPVHHFSCLIEWKEFMNERDLILYVFLKYMPDFLGIMLCLYVFQLCRKEEKISYFLQKCLPLVFVASLFLQLLSNLGSENYKIAFFQKYFHFQSSDWYFFNEVLRNPLPVFSGGSLMSIAIILISFQLIKSQTNKTLHNM